MGPRMELELVRIFDGFMKGQTLYKNANFVSPGQLRRERNERLRKISKIQNKKEKSKKKTELKLGTPEKSDGEEFDDFLNN